MVFVKKSPTNSGAIQVQIVSKQRGKLIFHEQIGSAHSEEELDLLVKRAHEIISDKYIDNFQLGLNFENQSATRASATEEMKVISTPSNQLWNGLCRAYDNLGFDVIADDVFKKLVLARIIEPTSKLDSIRVLEDVGVVSPSVATIYRHLKRVISQDYAGIISKQCLSYAKSKSLWLVLYDVTTLYFEIQKEDEYRKPGLSKERRLEPQIIIGLLVAQDGFPLTVHTFEGNKSETLTILPVVEKFQKENELKDLCIVADAAMLSASNLDSLEEKGFNYIVASRLKKTPFELDTYLVENQKDLVDNQIFETRQTMGTGKKRKQRRVVYQYRKKRAQLDHKNIDTQVEKALRVINGKSTVKKQRFLKLKGTEYSLDQAVLDQARKRAGIKGYVTNLDSVKASSIINWYHSLFEVERSFRMSKSDLKARPVFHQQRESIEAHVTIVFCALGVSRYIQSKTGLSISRFVKTLRPIRSAQIQVGTKIITIDRKLTIEQQEIIDAITDTNN